MLIALVTDDMRVVDIVKIFGANDRDMQDTHRPLDIVSMDPLGLCQFLLSRLKLGIVGEDVLLDLMFALDELILCRNVLLTELSQVNSTVLILIKFIKKLVYNLCSMLIVNSLSR